ncbi:MAG: hypothetical protein AAFP97_07555 [Pseudomonadota bacterium]
MKSIPTLILAGVTAMSLAQAATAHDLKHSHNGHTHSHASHDGQANMADRHGKPSAPVQFNHDFQASFSVGRFTDVIVTAAGNDQQTFSMVANGTPDLEVGKVTALPVTRGEAPRWQISVRPTTDGVHYLNVIGMTESGDIGFTQARIQSIRIDLGGSSKSFNAAQKPVLAERAGRSVAVFQAKETIER